MSVGLGDRSHLLNVDRIGQIFTGFDPCLLNSTIGLDNSETPIIRTANKDVKPFVGFLFSIVKITTPQEHHHHKKPSNEPAPYEFARCGSVTGKSNFAPQFQRFFLP